jgi:hypothetical protein
LLIDCLDSRKPDFDRELQHHVCVQCESQAWTESRLEPMVRCENGHRPKRQHCRMLIFNFRSGRNRGDELSSRRQPVEDYRMCRQVPTKVGVGRSGGVGGVTPTNGHTWDAGTRGTHHVFFARPVRCLRLLLQLFFPINAIYASSAPRHHAHRD